LDASSFRLPDRSLLQVLFALRLGDVERQQGNLKFPERKQQDRAELTNGRYSGDPSTYRTNLVFKWSILARTGHLITRPFEYLTN
jgi:hypothetical protein